MGAIELRDVSFCYRDNETSFLALEHIDLTVAAGEFLCLVGHYYEIGRASCRERV